ncbi:MAG: hypothetical protein LBG59_02410 [Candidatus Peribacteria bacterium]|nr:hypothetical protein [Candidatus Peribacteria bacterium]
MNGLNLSERSNTDIIKLVNEYNDLHYDKSSKSDSRAELLAMALEGRYTKRQELEDELADNGIRWNDDLSKKIWKIWKENGLVS